MDAITRHHYTNIANGMSVENADGSLSTVKNITIERDGLHYVLPTIWDGREVDTQTAIRNSTNINIEWPVFNSEEEANAWYEKTKKTWQPIGNNPVAARKILDEVDRRSLISMFE